MCVFQSWDEVSFRTVPPEQAITAYKWLGVSHNGSFESPYFYRVWPLAELHLRKIHGARPKKAVRLWNPGIHCYGTRQFANDYPCGDVLVKLEIWGDVYEYGHRNYLGDAGFLAQHAKIVGIMGHIPTALKGSITRMGLENRVRRAIDRYSIPDRRNSK